jgi:hypothetical protein
MNILTATRSYEAWLRRHTRVASGDLRVKHKEMKRHPFVFLRATFYRWAQRWPQVCPDLVDAPPVLAVGDLHLENFGTWRDDEGRLVWGVNDPDEAYPLPYTQDLVRLATSAALAKHLGELAISIRNACGEIVEGYADAIAAGGEPIVLAETHRWLAEIAQYSLKDPEKFWDKLARAPKRGGPPPGAAAAILRLPKGTTDIRIRPRTAGMGSLGRPRFVALGTRNGARIAREAKVVVPSACEWARPEGHREKNFAARLFERAVRDRDPFFAVRSGWSIRRLSPDCTKIDVSHLPDPKYERKLLYAMGWETANVHLGTARRVDIRRDLMRRKSKWLDAAARDMVEAVVDDWWMWKKTG